MEVPERLRLYNRCLFRICSKRVNMQFSASGLEINIRERQKAVGLCQREFCKYAAIVCEPLKVGVTLLIEICTHLLDLKIGHIAQVAAERAFVRLGAVELKTLNETSFRQQLPRRYVPDRSGKSAGAVAAGTRSQ